MKKLKDVYGFPVINNKKDGTIGIESNCEYPQQSFDCTCLFQNIERIFIEAEKLEYPLNIKEWKVILEPSKENIDEYYSVKGTIKYLQEIKNRLTDTITFFKPEVYYAKDQNLPNIIFHFYQVNYEGTLNIGNSYDFSDNCFIHYKNTDQLTPDRIQNLEKENIKYRWIRHIPFFPLERITFDSDNNITNFRHQELNS